eukprot:3109196-Rhodomonas_salina.3
MPPGSSMLDVSTGHLPQKLLHERRDTTSRTDRGPSIAFISSKGLWTAAGWTTKKRDMAWWKPLPSNRLRKLPSRARYPCLSWKRDRSVQIRL